MIALPQKIATALLLWILHSMKLFTILLCLTALASGANEKTISPFSLLHRTHPSHPALQLGLEKKPLAEAHQAITEPDFLTTLTPAQKAPLIQLRDVLAANLRAAGHPNFPPPAGYLLQPRSGWPVILHQDLTGPEFKRALHLLDQQLQAITDRLPAHLVAYLKKVPLFFTPGADSGHGACHHPGGQWLLDNGKPIEMAKTIEFSNLHKFEHETRRMPNVALHELSHAYHNHILGDDHAGLLAAFTAAEKSGTYVNLAKRSGDYDKPYRITEGKTYAMSNQMEYFAEATEAYFHENDYYPHRRAQLIEHDPKVVPVLEKVWGVQKPQNTLLSANRILSLGNTTTGFDQNITQLQAALHLKGHTPEVIALSLESESISQLSERLDRVLTLTNPDLIFASYQVKNDTLSAYQKGIQNLTAKAKAHGAELIILTPDDQNIANTLHQALLKNPLPELPADLLKFYQTRQGLLSPAWLTHTGHTQPNIKPGLPLKEAQAKAAFTIR